MLICKKLHNKEQTLYKFNEDLFLKVLLLNTYLHKNSTKYGKPGKYESG